MRLTHVIEQLEAVDASMLGVAEIATTVTRIRQARGFLDGLEAEVARRANQLHREVGALPATDVLARNSKSSQRAAARTAQRAEVLGATPQLGGALADGAISTEHADVVASAARRLDDERRGELFDHDAELTNTAVSSTPDEFRRHVNRLVAELTNDDGRDTAERQRAAATLSMGYDADTGMGYLRSMHDVESFQRIRRAIDVEANRLSKLAQHRGTRRERLNAIALTELVSGARRTSRSASAQIGVIIELDVLRNGHRPGQSGVCEYSDGVAVPVETARRLACDADILPIVLGDDGLPLDVGRARRLATPEQRLALRAMYRTCAIEHCTTPFDDCEIHHLLEWVDAHGPTDLENLLPICLYHHHLAHEGRWRLELRPSDRQLTVRLPDRTMHSSCLPDLLAERRHTA